MKKSVTEEITEACANVKARGLHLCRGGPWLTRDEKTLIGVDPIAAVLFVHGSLTDVQTGRLTEVCKILHVNDFWLYRFWLGWDRGFLMHFTVLDKNKKEVTLVDEISQFGIALSRSYPN